MFEENKKIINAVQHWIGIAKDSTQDVLVDLWKSKDPDLQDLYKMTQDYYKSKGISSIKLYRGCADTYGWDKTLCSWTRDKKLAASYLTGEIIRGHSLNELIGYEFDVEQILFDTELLEEYFGDPDEVLGMIPCDQLIVINCVFEIKEGASK
jgi:hypothetical protein